MNDPGGGHVLKPSPGCRRIAGVKRSRGGQPVKRAVRLDQGQVGGEDTVGSLE